MYRVFDKKNNCFVSDGILLTPDGNLVKSSKSFFGWNKLSYVSHDRYIYQESINLCDKNGTPIYIGDYVDAKVAEDKEVHGIVIYAEELSSYVIICFDIDEYFTLGSQVSDFIEVTGNVFDE